MRKIILSLCILLIIIVIANADINNASDLSLTSLEQHLEQSNIENHEFELGVYDCREFSAALSRELELSGYTCGTCRIWHNETTNTHETPAHRIVWVDIDNDIYFVEPQTDQIMMESELADVYGQIDKIEIFDN